MAIMSLKSIAERLAAGEKPVWDEGERSWYLYQNPLGPDHASVWNLVPSNYVEVDAIALLPSMWGDRPLAHQGEGAILILRGMRDLRASGGIGLFPEILKSELHGVRATIEAYSRNRSLAGKGEPMACGYDLRRQSGSISRSWDAVVEVEARGLRQTYVLDRWD